MGYVLVKAAVAAVPIVARAGMSYLPMVLGQGGKHVVGGAARTVGGGAMTTTAGGGAMTAASSTLPKIGKVGVASGTGGAVGGAVGAAKNPNQEVPVSYTHLTLPTTPYV